jgi:hypothetical protein
VEISSFARPDHLPESPAAPTNELGLRNVAFEVHDLQAAVDRAASDSYGPVGGIGEYEGYWRMAYVRGLEGIIVSLAERDRLSLPLSEWPARPVVNAQQPVELTINTRILSMTPPVAYRRHIENHIRAGNTTLPRLEA